MSYFNNHGYFKIHKITKAIVSGMQMLYHSKCTVLNALHILTHLIPNNPMS